MYRLAKTQRRFIITNWRYSTDFKRTFSLTCRTTILFDASDRFACVIQHRKAKNLLFPTRCCNINLVKPFRNLMLLNTRSTAKNLHSRHDHY